MKRQVKLRPSPAITDEQSDAEDVEEVRGIWREKDKIFISTTLPSLELERTFINYSFFRYNSYFIREQPLYLFDDSCRIAGYDCHRRNIFSYHATGSHYRSIANPYTWKYGRIYANPNIVLNHKRNHTVVEVKWLFLVL